MRIVCVDVVGDPAPGMLNLHCSAPGGGRSTVGHLVQEGRPGDWPGLPIREVVASELARRINGDRQWCHGYFQAEASGTRIMIICKDEVANVTVYGDPDVDTLKVSDWGK